MLAIAGDRKVLMEPKFVLDSHWVKKDSSLWSRVSSNEKIIIAETTWEDSHLLSKKFPHIKLEDKVTAKGGEIDELQRSQRVPTNNPKYFH